MCHSFLEGCLIGLAYAAPIGPIAVLCIRRTLTENRLAGIVSGLGSATGIAIYSGMVWLGVNLVADFLAQQDWLHVLGGVFLCYLGGRIALSQTSQTVIPSTQRSCWRYYGTTLLLALVLALPDPTFPVFVLSRTDHLAVQQYTPIPFSSGVLVSEALWWLLFCSLCWKLRAYLKPKRLQWVNYISGSVIAFFGVTTVLNLAV